MQVETTQQPKGSPPEAKTAMSATLFCNDYLSSFKNLPEINLCNIGQKLREEQEKDPSFRKIILYLRQGILPTQKSQNYNLKKRAANYALAGGVLFRSPDLRTRDSSEFPAQIVLPQSFRREVLEACHDHPLAGHMGADRTLQKVSQRFWWPAMQHDVAH